MGGNAFAHAASPASPTLNTPRMNPEKYEELKSLYEAKLRQFLPGRKINTLKEAPEKTLYGDLDFLIESADEPVDWVSLAGKLGAAGLITHSVKVQCCSIAVPTDGSTSSKLTIYKHKHNLAQVSEELTTEEYAQIDLEIVPQDLLEWHSFYSSYGDMNGLLGHIIHNLGFTICDKGLMLRLAALDASKEQPDKNIAEKDGRLFLSKDPQQVLTFLGLSFEAYQKGFATVEEFYGWLGQCTLLSKDSIKVKRDDANARQKQRKRPLYTNFFDTWLPAYFESKDSNDAEGLEKTPSRTSSHSSRREDLQLRAVSFFDKQAEYEMMNTALVRQIHSRTVDNLLKPIIRRHTGYESESANVKRKVADVVRGFRRWVSFRDGSPYILDAPHDDAQSELYKFLDDENELELRDEDEVSEWVKENWEVIKGLERERVKGLEPPV